MKKIVTSDPVKSSRKDAKIGDNVTPKRKTKPLATRSLSIARSAPASLKPSLESIRVLDYLGRHFSCPISLLAVMAAWDIKLSGSEALGFFVKGHGSTHDSDLDFYGPWSSGALVDICHVFNHAEIQWSNYLLRKLKDLDGDRKVIIIPCAMIASLAIILDPKQPEKQSFSTRALRKYLDGRVEARIGQSAMTKRFLTQFCAQVKELHQSAVSTNDMEPWIWVFDATSDTPSDYRYHTGKFMGKLVGTLAGACDTLRERDCSRSDLSELLQDWITDNETPIVKLNEQFTFRAGGKTNVQLEKPKVEPNITVLKQAWYRTGLTDAMLHEYLTYTLKNEIPFDSPSKIHALVNEALQLDTELSKQKYGDDFRIMRGEMANGKKIEIILDVENQRHPLYTFLQFYATHPMCFIGGTAGAHLYYSTAQHVKSQKLDFRKDRRQERAEWAIEHKYEPKGWIFEDMNREEVHSRSMCDQHTKMVDFEPLYAAALRQVHHNDRMPDEINSFFRKKKNALQSFTWVEEKGKIPKYRIGNTFPTWSHSERDSKIWAAREFRRERFRMPAYKATSNESPDEGAAFIEWVHSTLADHKQVISRTEWDEKSILEAKLDVFFGGFCQDHWWPEIDPFGLSERRDRKTICAVWEI